LSLENREDHLANESPSELREPHYAVDMQRASEYLKYLKKYPRSKQICICGHTVASHHYSTVVGYNCKPNNHFCPCERLDPVYFASNANHFKRSTHGPGMKHALALGITSLLASGSSGEWLIRVKCMYPDCKNLEILPAPLSKDRRIVGKPSNTNVLLCREHIIEFGGNLI
jgi:hypothetical protein